MTDKEFNKEIKGGLSGGYLLYGEEEYLKKHYLDMAVFSVIGENNDFSELNLIKVSRENYSASALSDALSTYPMMSEKVCVVCSILPSFLSEKEIDSLCNVLEKLSSYSAVLLITVPAGGLDTGNIKRNRPSAVYKKICEYLKPVEFPRQAPSVLKKWITRHFEADGLSSDTAALDLLCDLCDCDMTTLGTECEKLICFAKANNESVITERLVKEICSEYGEAGAFALTNAISAGDRAEALRVLKEYKEKKRSAVMVLAGIISDFSNMLAVALYMKNGMYKRDIAAKTGLHEFRVGRYMDAAQSIGASGIKAVLNRCREADADLKSSGIDYVALERLICTMPAKKRSGY